MISYHYWLIKRNLQPLSCMVHLIIGWVLFGASSVANHRAGHSRYPLLKIFNILPNTKLYTPGRQVGHPRNSQLQMLQAPHPPEIAFIVWLFSFVIVRDHLGNLIHCRVMFLCDNLLHLKSSVYRDSRCRSYMYQWKGSRFTLHFQTHMYGA